MDYKILSIDKDNQTTVSVTLGTFSETFKMAFPLDSKANFEEALLLHTRGHIAGLESRKPVAPDVSITALLNKTQTITTK